jgi:hypothetical protein
MSETFMNEQNWAKKTTLQRPTNEDKMVWWAYWKAQGQPWRREPEIDEERQNYLTKQLKIKPDMVHSIYPFRDIKLCRADIEWLLGVSENGGVPIDLDPLNQSEIGRLDLRGTDLRNENLHLFSLNEVSLREAQLQDADLSMAQLCKTILMRAKLQGANLVLANLAEANLREAQFQGANLRLATLQRAIFCGAQLQSVSLSDAKLADEHHIGPRLADVQWGDTNLAVVDWSQVKKLGDEYEAQQKLDADGEEKTKNTRIREYQEAVRANRQLSIVLRNQGLNEHASRFAYHAQLMQRKVFWYQRKFLSYLGSLFLDLLSGYGYKVGRCFIAYALVIGVFATIYHLLGTHPSWNESIVISMTAFHGRGFFPEQFHPGDPQALAAAIEAFVGLLIEITLIATLTQRFFGR